MKESDAIRGQEVTSSHEGTSFDDVNTKNSSDQETSNVAKEYGPESNEKLTMFGRQQVSSHNKRSNAKEYPQGHSPVRDNLPQPGVEFVPWGLLGPPTRYNQQPRSVSRRQVPQPNGEQTMTPQPDVQYNSEEFPIKWRCGKFLIGGAVGLVLLIAIGTGVGLTVFRKRKPSSNRETSLTVMELPTQSCALLFDHPQPNVVTLCFCSGKISLVATDVAAEYQRLRSGSLLHSLALGFNSSLDSCDPVNQVLVWLASGSGQPSPDANLRQRYVLALLFILWNGVSWTSVHGWLSSDNECTWTGVTCHANGEVAELDLMNNNFGVNLGSEIALLTSLTSLSLINNDIQGSLPSEIGTMSSLELLRIQQNFMGGKIPTEMGKLSSLTSLSLQSNLVHGILPTELALLPRLESLDLSSNQISGSLPTEFGRLLSLTHIDLGYNALTGRLPTEIGLLQARFISMANNQFNSTIPNEIGFVSTLQNLWLSNAGIVGKLPLGLFGLSLLQYLSLESNSMFGTIPTLIGKLSALSTYFPEKS